MYYTRQIPAGILVAHTRRFSSEKEAEEWNERTGICLNFELMSAEDVEAWENEVIWVPMGRKKNERE